MVNLSFEHKGFLVEASVRKIESVDDFQIVNIKVNGAEYVPWNILERGAPNSLVVEFEAALSDKIWVSLYGDK